MKRNKEENTVFVLQKAIRRFKIKVTDTSIREFLLAHPYYPSLKSVCDALNKWGVEYYPLKLEIDEIKDLEMPFIAHLRVFGGQLVFVEKIENGHVFYSAAEGKNQKEVFSKFAEKLSGAVIVMEAGKDSGEKGYRQIRQNEILNKILLPFGIFTVLLVCLLGISQNFGDLGAKHTLILWGLIITKITGIVASLLLVMHEFKIHSPLIDKICGFSSKTDCDEVLASNASQLFGWFNWADAGLIYFISTLIYILGVSGNPSFGFLAIISLVSLPYPAFSIYYQSVKLKKWCPFCVLVQLVLIAEFVLLLPVFKTMTFTGTDALKLINSFFVTASLWLIYKAYYNKTNEIILERNSFLHFKRNPEIFAFLLTSNGYHEIFEDKDSLILGSPDATITVTAFLSLYCNPCAKAFKQIKTLLENHTDIKVNVIFSVYDDEETLETINTLYYLYTKKSSEVIIDFLDKWYSIPIPSRKSLIQNELVLEQYNMAKIIKDKNKRLFAEYKVEGTPTIYICGYLFPIQYGFNYIEYYLEEIKALKREGGVKVKANI